MQLFPPEIINHTTQSHFAANKTNSKIIYCIVLVFIVVAIALLPFITVDVTTQTRGVIRTQSENSQLQSTVYGEVSFIALNENVYVTKGDVLLEIKAEKINEQIAERQRDLKTNKNYIVDLQKLINEQGEIETAKYNQLLRIEEELGDMAVYGFKK